GARDAGGRDEGRAGPGPPRVGARLERAIQRGAPGARPRILERNDLCVRSARDAMRAPAHDDSVAIDDQGADEWIRARRPASALRERDRLAHEIRVRHAPATGYHFSSNSPLP